MTLLIESRLDGLRPADICDVDRAFCVNCPHDTDKDGCKGSPCPKPERWLKDSQGLAGIRTLIFRRRALGRETVPVIALQAFLEGDDIVALREDIHVWQRYPRRSHVWATEVLPRGVVIVHPQSGHMWLASKREIDRACYTNALSSHTTRPGLLKYKFNFWVFRRDP